MPRRPTAERPLPAFPPTEPVSPFSDPVSTTSSYGPHHAPSRPSPLNPTLGGDNMRSPKRNRETNYTIGSNSTQPPSRNSRNSEAGPSSGSGSSEDSERDLHDIQAGHIGANYGPYPTFITSPGSDTSSAPLRRPSLPFSSQHKRFSTVSSEDSVLGFMSDSKYAMPYVSYSRHPRGEVKSMSGPMWGLYDRVGGPVDDDDYLHEPTGENMKMSDTSWRGVLNVGVLGLIIFGVVTLFAGYPLIHHFTEHRPAWTKIITNGTGQIPKLDLPQLIDPDTPKEFMTRTGLDGKEYELVFSDEFEKDGRSFYPGDDPFWEAVDLWYQSTQDLEWYDPGQITTRDGKLVIVIEEATNDQHPGLPYVSGMLQSWNKFCFTTGYIEVSVMFPSQAAVAGYWPGAWIMGNLGRPGYGATADGLWPYSYDTCDWGTLPNQTFNGQPELEKTSGNPKYNYNLSWLPGQRLSACTCPGEDHPGPSVTNGRAAPEIDIFEAQINKDTYAGGRVTQSVQMAPFSAYYYFPNTSVDATIIPATGTKLNSYRGSGLQQAVSALTDTNDTNYMEYPGAGGPQYNPFGFEYWSDPNSRSDGYIYWVAGSPVFRASANVFAADPSMNISARLVPEEPMSIVLNLAVSESFQKIDWEQLTFPNEFKIDYVRVWQRKGLSDEYRTCDPKSHPTADYINRHPAPYSNAQLKTWAQANNTFPKNSLTSPCS